MTGTPELHGYHIHIYFNDETRSKAEKVRNQLAANFPIELGKNVGVIGPHLVPQMNIVFRTEAFAEIVPWLMFNHEGLDVLIHPLSNDEYDDHTINALWLGKPVPLKLETLPHGPYPAELLPKADAAAATE
jgi:aromatic ring-cleaving dioxygenase